MKCNINILQLILTSDMTYFKDKTVSTECVCTVNVQCIGAYSNAFSSA